MNETITQDARYPEWMKAWNAKGAEIDQQIIDFCATNAEQTSDSLDLIGAKLQSWWDKQHLDEIVSAEWQKVRADAVLYRAQVNNRLQHLIADKKIAWAKRESAAGAP
jgi:hypothetical protein